MGAGAFGAPTNNVGDGKIAGAAPGEDPPVYVKRKRENQHPVGRYDTRRTWASNEEQIKVAVLEEKLQNFESLVTVRFCY